MLKAVYNFNPKNAICSLDAQGDCPAFPYPLWCNILCNCHIDFRAIIEDFQSVQAQYDDSIQLGEGKELTVHHGATGKGQWICTQGVRGGCRLGARERSAGELESGLGWRDGQEATMGLSLGLLSRMGSVRWLPAWEGVSPGSFIGREFEKKTKFSPSCEGSYYIQSVWVM